MLPETLPAQFSAHLSATVHCVLAHRILDGDNRAYVVEPKEGGEPLAFEAALDQEDGTVRILDFPTVTDRVGTDLGEVEATVAIEGEPEGRYDAESGDVTVRVTLLFDPDHLLAKASRVALTLSSAGAFDEAELAAEGAPLDLAGGTLTLVGEGTFEGGTLEGGSCWLAIGCEIEDVVER